MEGAKNPRIHFLFLLGCLNDHLLSKSCCFCTIMPSPLLHKTHITMSVALLPLAPLCGVFVILCSSSHFSLGVDTLCIMFSTTASSRSATMCFSSNSVRSRAPSMLALVCCKYSTEGQSRFWLSAPSYTGLWSWLLSLSQTYVILELLQSFNDLFLGTAYSTHLIAMIRMHHLVGHTASMITTASQPNINL